MKNNTYYYRHRGGSCSRAPGRPSTSTKVLRVENDPAEDGYP